MKSKRLERELEVTISEEDRAQLDEYVATLPPEEAAPLATQEARSGTGRKKGPEI
jgi:hypothetical protein